MPKASRERLCEYAFETLQVPAYFCVRDAVLSSFALGKSSGLIVDSSASCTSVTPVHDGYTINKAIQKSPMGGDLLSKECKLIHEAQLKPQDLQPRYRIASRVPVGQNQPSSFTPRNVQGTTDSFHAYMEMRMWDEFKESTIGIMSDMRYDEEMAKTRFAKSFEFPSGYNSAYQQIRFRLGEIFFQPMFSQAVVCIHDNYLNGTATRYD